MADIIYSLMKRNGALGRDQYRKSAVERGAAVSEEE
jgi:hypothetical protein